MKISYLVGIACTQETRKDEVKPAEMSQEIIHETSHGRTRKEFWARLCVFANFASLRENSSLTPD